jgi:FkbM family methyltransferase
MTQYWDERFMKHISNIRTIFEVGARYGDESIQLSYIFKAARIYSFECNPLTINICKSNLSNYPNINFFDYGLGTINEELPFFSYIKDNDGASSLLKRIDFKETQKQTGIVKIRKLADFVRENNIVQIDLLCMDVQGYELNILKGSDDFIKNIKYVIMEEPKPVINTEYLPNGVHSKYLNSPTSEEIRTFMEANGFEVLERLSENAIEDNVLYKNKHF